MPDKLDLVKAHKNYYGAQVTPSLGYFGPLPYLSIRGRGEPESEIYTAALSALYSVAYGVKKLCKAEGRDFVVPKLEGLWWVDGGETLPPLEVPRARWNWRLMVQLSAFVTGQRVEAAKIASIKRSERSRQVTFETFDEGTCVQVLHYGPYSTEPETLGRLDAFIDAEGLKRNGLHHEIYLTDPRRSAPEKLRTILRQPVRLAAYRWTFKH